MTVATVAAGAFDRTRKVCGTALRRHGLEAVLVIVGYGLVAVVLTWPLVLHFDTRIPGPRGGDALGYLFDFEQLARAGLPFIKDYVQEGVAAPFGRPASAAANLTLLYTLFPAMVLTKIVGPIAAFNALMLAGVALSGAGMYLLVRWLGLGAGPAAWSGLVYALFPYHQLALTGFVTLVAYEVFPLLLMALIAWNVRPGRGSGAAVVAMVLLAWLTSVYFGVMAMIMLAVAVIAAAVRHARARGWRTAARQVGALTAGLLAAVIVPLGTVFLINRGGTTGDLARDPAALEVFGARFSDFVLPAKTDPFLTKLIGPEWYGMGSVGGERLAYLGWVTIALGMIGLVLGLRARRQLDPRIRTALWLCPLVGIGLLLFCLRSPYPIAGIEFPTPTAALFEAFPYVRAFGRFVIAIIACVLVLGAIGLRLMMGSRAAPARYAIVGGALVLSALELSLGGAAIETSVPSTLDDGRPAETQPHWEWLRRHDRSAIVVEYPEVGNQFHQRYYMWGHFFHGHPVLNAVSEAGYPGGEFTREVTSPRTKETAVLLATAGVRYATLNPWAFTALGISEPRELPPGFRLLERFEDGASVWEVVARPADGFGVFMPGGFDVQHIEAGRNWRWMISPRGTVDLYVRAPGTYRAIFTVSAAGGRTYSLRAVSGDGFSDTARVASQRDVSLLVHAPAGKSTVTLEVSPGPREFGNPTVRMTPWVLQRAVTPPITAERP